MAYYYYDNGRPCPQYYPQSPFDGGLNPYSASPTGPARLQAPNSLAYTVEEYESDEDRSTPPRSAHRLPNTESRNHDQFSGSPGRVAENAPGQGYRTFQERDSYYPSEHGGVRYVQGRAENLPGDFTGLEHTATVSQYAGDSSFEPRRYPRQYGYDTGRAEYLAAEDEAFPPYYSPGQIYRDPNTGVLYRIVEPCMSETARRGRNQPPQSRHRRVLPFEPSDKHPSRAVYVDGRQYYEVRRRERRPHQRAGCVIM